jgi:hypothetical protein
MAGGVALQARVMGRLLSASHGRHQAQGNKPHANQLPSSRVHIAFLAFQKPDFPASAREE